MDQPKIPLHARYLTGSSHGNSLGQGMVLAQLLGVGDDGFIELPGLHVRVNDVVFQPQALVPMDVLNRFVYYITIHNDSDTLVIIKGRKWVVTESSGEVIAVEGDGVVGEFPCLEPGEHFTYNSSHVFGSPKAVATGSYLGVDDLQNRVIVRIPEFEMEVPDPDIGYV